MLNELLLLLEKRESLNEPSTNGLDLELFRCWLPWAEPNPVGVLALVSLNESNVKLMEVVALGLGLFWERTLMGCSKGLANNLTLFVFTGAFMGVLVLVIFVSDVAGLGFILAFKLVGVFTGD